MNHSQKGFTIVEVMMASVVMVLGITTSITTLQRGLRAVDTARRTTAASQVMQNEVETLRLRTWGEICALPAQGEFVSDSRMKGVRVIEDPVGAPGLKVIKLTVSWNGLDGSPHRRNFETLYAENGLNSRLGQPK